MRKLYFFKFYYIVFFILLCYIFYFIILYFLRNFRVFGRPVGSEMDRLIDSRVGRARDRMGRIVPSGTRCPEWDDKSLAQSVYL